MSRVRTGQISRGRAAFTLIEVLIATFIIGLGVLGLLALFAGAARQQQASSQETAATFVARNARVNLEEGFGALQGGTIGGVPDGVWVLLPMDARYNFLSVNPRGETNGPYFLSSPTSSMPFTMYVHPELQGAQGVGGGFEEAPGAPVEYQFVDNPTGIFSSPLWTYLFSDRRIDPPSLSIRITVSWLEDAGGVYTRRQETLAFARNPSVIYASDGNSATNGIWMYPLNADESHDPLDGVSVIPGNQRSYVLVDTQPQIGGEDRARIYSIHVGRLNEPAITGLSPRVDAIEAATYRWRNDQLVSLSDRVTERPDASTTSGRRDDQCYSVLYRVNGQAGQSVVLAYQLTPVSAPQQPFVPPETLADLNSNRGPVREVTLPMRFDSSLDQYYFRVSDERLLWAIRPGQVLVVQGDPSMPGNPGADEPVRVIRFVQETQAQGSQWRGYIDRAPRRGDLSFLTTLQANNGSSVSLRLLAIADQVRSRSDNSIWKLTPLRAETFPVSFAP